MDDLCNSVTEVSLICTKQRAKKFGLVVCLTLIKEVHYKLNPEIILLLKLNIQYLKLNRSISCKKMISITDM